MQYNNINKGKCKCANGYSGEKCEILTSVQFKYEDSYMEMETPDLEQEVNITFTIITSIETGVLVYHGSKSRPHLAVELFKGRIRVSFDVGNEAASVTSIYSYAKINDSELLFNNFIF